MARVFVDETKLNRFLLDRFWTARKLSEASGTNYGTILACITGKGSVRMGTLRKICKALECKPTDITRV